MKSNSRNQFFPRTESKFLLGFVTDAEGLKHRICQVHYRHRAMNTPWSRQWDCITIQISYAFAASGLDYSNKTSLEILAQARIKKLVLNAIAAFWQPSAVVTWFTLAVCCHPEQIQGENLQNSLEIPIYKADVLPAPKTYYCQKLLCLV